MTNKDQYGDEFLKEFRSLFDEHSIKNPAYALMILHVILGQALKHIYFRVGARKIDIRMHLLLIRPSGTGKGAGYSFFSRLTKDLGLRNEMLTESTDAGLAGTGTTNKEGEIEINEGLMKGADFISMEEGSSLFDYSTDLSKKNLTYMQIAMNPLHDESCRIVKKIGSLPEAISFKPHCSFLILTYLPDKFLDSIIKRGVIQRFVTVMQHVSLEERMDVVDTAIDKLNLSTEKDFEDKYQLILSKLKVIVGKYQKLGGYEKISQTYGFNDIKLKKLFDACSKSKLNEKQLERLSNIVSKELAGFEEDEWYLKYGYQFDISDKSKEEIRQVEHEFMNMIKDTTSISQEKLQEFTHRVFEILVRFAILHSIICLRQSVETEDVLFAKNFFKQIWTNIIYNIEDLLVPDSSQRVKLHMIIDRSVTTYHHFLKDNDKKYVKDGIWVRRGSLLKALQPLWDNCSYVTAHHRLCKIETENIEDINKNKWFLKKKFGSNQYIKLIQDIS
jgi:hypothetical protein